jgi:hypothetical protein
MRAFWPSVARWPHFAHVSLRRTAERYVRFCDTSTLTFSLDRQRRQVSYLKAFTTKVLQNATGDPAALLSLYQTAQDYT